MRIFITGGTGFIGNTVVNNLKNHKHLLLLLSHKKEYEESQYLKVVKGDLANISSWQKQLIDFKPEACIHMAWEGLPDHSSHISKLNLGYGLNLTELLAKIGCKRLIVTGSGWEYGSQAGKLSENATPKSFDAFTAAKQALHWLGEEIAKENNMQFIWTRLYYVYGPGQHSLSLIPYLIKCAKTGKKPEIRNPQAKNDFIFVEDVADALCEILKNCYKNDDYNIGSGKLTSVSYIMNYIFNSFGIKCEYKKGKHEHRDSIKYSYADISKITNETGWEPKVSIEEGIQKTIDYYRHE